MLLSLEIRNIALIESLSIAFAPGLNVLTGETGAGKSILLDALGFAIGRGAGGDRVGAAGSTGSATAVFALGADQPARELLAEHGYAAEGDELVLRRVAGKGGAARAFVNDQRASAGMLRRLGDLLVEVHGQHDDRGLLDPRTHRPLLDAFGELGELLALTRRCWAEASAAEQRLAEARAALERAAEDADFMRHGLDELSRLDPQPGEADRLDTERRLMQAAARIREEIARAAAALSSEGAEGALGEALSRLTHVAGQAEGLLDAPIEAIDRAMVELGEAQRGVDAALARLDHDPADLEAVEERLFAIRALARKHRVEADALPDLAAEFTRRLEEIDLGAGRIAALEAELEAARARYGEAARSLSAERRKAARRLDRLVTRELAPLRMEKARFHTVLGAREAGPEGTDEVAFTASINPGVPAGPIDRIASGGELSRFLLALKVCLAARMPGRTMIFDEIDRGVGGATADAVGRRLARLAAGGQVIVVTHSPQVAARGHHHWQIVKRTVRGRTRTEVLPLDPDRRIDEIARMLAGARVTPEARSAAQALIGETG